MRISDRESANALRESKATIELTRTVKVSSMNRKMKARPQSNVCLGLKLNVGRLHRRL